MGLGIENGFSLSYTGDTVAKYLLPVLMTLDSTGQGVLDQKERLLLPPGTIMMPIK